MCEPITIAAVAAIAMAAAGTAASLKAQSDQAGAQKDYQNKVQAANTKAMEENRVLATQSFLDQSYQESRNILQERAAATEALIQESIKARQARGKVLTHAAAGGVEGVSVQQLLEDFHRQEAMFNANVQTNLKYKGEASCATIRAYQGEFSGRVASLKPFIPQPIQQPDYLGGVLRFGGGALNAYSSLKTPTPATTNGTENIGGGARPGGHGSFDTPSDTLFA